MCFAGRYTVEADDTCYQYNFENENWRDDIDDPEVLELLEGEYENWKEWQNEEEVE